MSDTTLEVCECFTGQGHGVKQLRIRTLSVDTATKCRCWTIVVLGTVCWMWPNVRRMSLTVTVYVNLNAKKGNYIFNQRELAVLMISVRQVNFALTEIVIENNEISTKPYFIYLSLYCLTLTIIRMTSASNDNV